MLDLKSIWALQKPSKDELIIKTKIDVVPQFDCYAATNHITGNHLYIMSLSSHAIIPEFKNFKFKGVQIEVFDLKESKELNIYLIDNELKGIFSLFIENIIEEIIDSTTENEAITKTSNVIQKWKKLFDKLNTQGLSIEQQKGLLGELIFIDELIDNKFNPDYVLNGWTGPDFEDKDFTFGSTCFEIKFTSSKLPRIKITSERQLDTLNIDNLFLYCFACENLKEKGISLNSVVNSIRKKINSNSTTLKFFNERLESAGFFEDDAENYNVEYGIKTRSIYEVNESFPKLTNSNLPNGIYNTSYYIENSAIEDFRADYDTIINELKNE
ncbi:PD-(D/E)XK motif protein [Lacinutrix jangbogonensis]|uniref:PD-(D/E)XK motif protein n=1 Tax=Lacinutrix jangbogonensis TaxID=1469557 RepID=UPI00053D7737|nr:PD-(D/E)XK motif protein [Lacinutrix jangbogonensis]